MEFRLTVLCHDKEDALKVRDWARDQLRPMCDNKVYSSSMQKVYSAEPRLNTQLLNCFVQLGLTSASGMAMGFRGRITDDNMDELVMTLMLPFIKDHYCVIESSSHVGFLPKLSFPDKKHEPGFMALFLTAAMMKYYKDTDPEHQRKIMDILDQERL